MRVSTSENRLPCGMTIYSVDVARYEYLVCKWYMYPIFKTLKRLEFKRCEFYWFLNRHNIMKTKDGCIMQLSDIWRR